MGKYFYFLVIYLLISTGCSPKIAEIDGNDLSFHQFIKQLSNNDPRYFGKKQYRIENKLSDWKRLKTALTDYLDEEAVWKELQNKHFGDSISKKKQELWFYGSLGEFTLISLKDKITLEKLKKKEKSLIFDQKALEENLKLRSSHPMLSTEIIVLSYPKRFALTTEEIVRFFPEKAQLDFINWVSNNLVPRLYLAIEGFRLGYHELPIFKNWWAMKKRKHLILLYEEKIKEKFKTHILSERQKELKNYYEKNKDRFVHYKPNQNKKKDELGEKYQLTYNRVEEDLVQTFLDQEIAKWQEKLKKKYKIKINNSYFQEFENGENQRLQGQINQN